MNRGLIFALVVALGPIAVAAQQERQPYSCRLLYDEQRACAYNPHCDRRVIERLTRECLRDGGRP